MKTKKLLHHLRDYLSGEHETHAQLDGMSAILEKLEKKEKKLESKLAAAETEEQKKRLTGKLKVIAAQLKKGREHHQKLSDGH